jgi:phosphoglycerol transferase
MLKIPFGSHFVLGLLLAFLLGCIPFLKKKKRMPCSFLLCYVFIVACDYYFLYYVLIKNTSACLAYFAPALLTACYYLFRPVTIEVNSAYKPRLIFLKISVLSFISLFCIALYFLIKWATKTFPIDNIDATLFTLLTSKAGTGNFVLDMWTQSGLLFNIVKYFGLLLGFELLLMIAAHKRQKSFTCGLGKFHFSFFATTSRAPLFLQISKAASIVLTLFVIFTFFIAIPAVDYAKAFYTAFKEPVDSSFYRDYYVYPDSVKITFPKEKKNLIVIMMESMETNFAPFTPEINSLTKQNLSFFPGGEAAANTDLTIASQTAKLCGIPLNPPLREAMFGTVSGIKNFLNHATCLTNIFAEAGYAQVYIQGSNSEFGSKKYLWTQHGNVAVHDLNYFEKEGLFKKEDEHFWGFDDAELYRLAKKDLEKLSVDSAKPFAFYLMTVDMHIPFGYLNPSCPQKAAHEELQYPAVVSCASTQLANFLNWIKREPWSKNTVIAVVGDHVHPYFNKSKDMNRFHIDRNLLGSIDEEKNHYWINFFINAPIKPKMANRKFNSFDMFPTFLEATGANIDGHALGFGRSLFSERKTLLEMLPKERIDSVLRERSVQYDYFMYGNLFHKTF